MIKLPPLSLYIHIPWCVHKCPYCDFNSHQIKGPIPEKLYIDHLIQDLKQDLKYVQGRKLISIFIGGGTPSVFSPDGIKKLLEQININIDFDSDIEITMEANPGTLDSNKFNGFIKTGINRLSLGIQSFNNQQLLALGRIHNSQQAINAIKKAQDTGFSNINLDLMHGLPLQTTTSGILDIEQAIALNPQHISYYQLTIEPNTAFFHRPPILPKDETLEVIETQGKIILAQAGFEQYEVSAYARNHLHSKHNTNYWKFGDYLGIGCGAAGKVTLTNQIYRTSKTKHPRGYLTGKYLNKIEQVKKKDLSFEFFMNRFRLYEACKKSELLQLNLPENDPIYDKINQLIDNHFIIENPDSWKLTKHGKLFLNDLLLVFLEE